MGVQSDPDLQDRNSDTLVSFGDIPVRINSIAHRSRIRTTISHCDHEKCAR
jgi:hypothetical protein